MDPNLIAVSARSLERLVAVLLGGLAIYYGFRLFLIVPVETQGDGKIKLPGLSVVLAKVGPGVFFTAFGVAVLVVALTQQVKVSGPDAEIVSFSERSAQPDDTNPARRPSPIRRDLPTDQELARALLAISVINCMNRLATIGVRRLPVQDAEIASRDAKLALLASVWKTKEWGAYSAFQSWVTRQTPSISSPARVMYEAVTPDCPQ